MHGRHYGREIGAWCIETGKQHVFGEDAGHGRAVMLIYTGTHYDALAIAKVYLVVLPGRSGLARRVFIFVSPRKHETA
jgi:hypothetical protein